jgi:alkylation response protein AidB-like acyl-CoA dehydrogenase
MYTKIEASRLMTLRAARMVDAGHPASKETASARIMASDGCYEVIDEALQILGGIGYTKDYPVEGLLRDTRIQRIGGGSSEIMRFLVAREAINEVRSALDS